MSYLDRSIKHGPMQLRGHTLGRFATMVNGTLEHKTGDRIDIHALVTGHKMGIDLMPIETNIMRNSGLHRGSIAVIDKGTEPKNGRLVVVRFNGAVVIRRLIKKNNQWCLVADDPREETLIITPEDTVERLGVVRWILIPTCENL